MADIRDLGDATGARGSFELVAGASPGDDFGAGFKVCSMCGDEKPLDEFHKDASGKLGRKSACKACVNPINRETKRREALKKVGSFTRAEILEAIVDRLIVRMGL